MVEREQWGSRLGFILAAVGSAIGLGNIWRFPYMTYENGGGAFLIPYFFALITAGIPLIILEFGLGHKFRGSAPLALAKARPGFEWLGWSQALIAFFISVYYVGVVAWSLNYVGFSFNLAWGQDANAFFFGSYLGLSDGAFDFGSLRPTILGALVLAWVINFIVLYSGVKKGIELANKIFIPILILMILIITVRGLTLPGAAVGLNYLFQPDFSKILDYKIWVAAYGQIFFTLSIGFAIMMAYSSYLPKKSDIINNGFITALGNCGFSLLAGIAVFSIVGWMAQTSGQPFEDVVKDGVGLAFVAFPTAISQMPTMPQLFGVLFFLSLVFAGLSSHISINEAVISGLMDKLNAPRKKVVTVYCLVAGIISLYMASGAGLYFLDIVDHFTNQIGIVFAGLIEVILIGWFFNINSIREHINPISDFQIGSWWVFCLKFITPVILGYVALSNLLGDIKAPYEGYPMNAIIMLGWSTIAIIIVGGYLLRTANWRNRELLKDK